MTTVAYAQDKLTPGPGEVELCHKTSRADACTGSTRLIVLYKA